MKTKTSPYPKLSTTIHKGPLPEPIMALEDIFKNGGVTLIEAAFKHSFFLDPEQVRGNTPKLPGFARYSRTHYPNKKKGDTANWMQRIVKIDDNSKAQAAWAQYSGRPPLRKSGYGVRHIWGNPWNPDVYTAGWNLCYMPFWVGMLTENQHPHVELQKAIKQAAFELFFQANPVCTPPNFIVNPGFGKELRKYLGTQPINILQRGHKSRSPSNTTRDVLPIVLVPPGPEFKKQILKTHQAIINIHYRDGHSVKKVWRVSLIAERSNIIGNIRSRPEFRAGIWQQKGIKSLRVTAL